MPPGSCGTNCAIAPCCGRGRSRTSYTTRPPRAGHPASPDRLASGLWPLCFGEATKVSRFLLEADKRYRAVFRLGVSTATGDSEGEGLETRPVTVSRRAIESALQPFTGAI